MRDGERCACPVCRALDLMFPTEGQQLALWRSDGATTKGTPRLNGHFVRRGR